MLLRKDYRRTWRSLQTEGIDDESHNPEYSYHYEKSYETPDDVLFASCDRFLFPATLVHEELYNTPYEYEDCERHHEHDDRVDDLCTETIDQRINSDSMRDMYVGKPPRKHIILLTTSEVWVSIDHTRNLVSIKVSTTDTESCLEECYETPH